MPMIGNVKYEIVEPGIISIEIRRWPGQANDGPVAYLAASELEKMAKIARQSDPEDYEYTGPKTREDRP